MNDPYSTLGVSPDATDAEVKKAYRELLRKYHPDNYQNNPLADLAHEKTTEINTAYDEITRRRGAGGARDGGYAGGGRTGSAGQTPESARIRAAINEGNIRLAEQLLSEYRQRDAEWNFLMGSLAYRKGWLDDAAGYYQTAVNMDPRNTEYRQALGYMNYGGQAYRPYGNRNAQTGGCDACDICAAMMCANMCCRCTI